MGPISSKYYANQAIFTYAVAAFSLPGNNDSYQALGFTAKTLLASSSVSLDIPQYADKITKSVKFELPAILSAICVSTTGDSYPMPSRLRAYGNLPGGAFPILFDGQPIQVLFNQLSYDLNINGPLSNISMSAIEIEHDFDMSQLITTPAFTADIASTDWSLVMVTRPIITLTYDS